MQYDRTGVRQFIPGLVEAELPCIFAHGRKQAAVLPFQLDAQHVDDVGAFQGVFHAGMIGDAQGFHVPGHQGTRPRHVDIGAELFPAGDVAAGHTAEEDVTEDDHLFALQVLDAVFPQGEQVQQALGRMGVGPVAGIDDDRSGDLCRIAGGTFAGAAHDDAVAAHVLQSQDGVAQAFALHDAGVARRDVDDIGAQVFCRRFKGRARTRAGLVEQRDDQLASQGRHLLDITLHDPLHFHGRVLDQVDFIDTEAFQVEDVPAAQGHIRFCHAVSSLCSTLYHYFKQL